MTKSEQEVLLETTAEQLQAVLESCWRSRHGHLGIEVTQARLVLKPQAGVSGQAAQAQSSEALAALLEVRWVSGPDGLPVRQVHASPAERKGAKE